jgi:hypothetical protein
MNILHDKRLRGRDEAIDGHTTSPNSRIAETARITFPTSPLLLLTLLLLTLLGSRAVRERGGSGG